MEKRVEEITDYVHRLLLTTERASSLRQDRHDPTAQGERLRAIAEDAIACLVPLILSAVRDGELELPGEVGRIKIEHWPQHFRHKEGDLIIVVREEKEK